MPYSLRRLVPVVLVVLGVIGLAGYYMRHNATSGSHQRQVASPDPRAGVNAAGAGGNDPAVSSTVFAEDDPSQDGWTTEVFAESTKQVLKDLVQLLEKPDEINEASGAALVVDSYQGSALLPQELKTVYRDEVFHVERLKPAPQTLSADEQAAANKLTSPWPDLLGAANLAAALEQWTAVFRGASDLRYEIKVVGVQMDESSAATTQLISVTARTDTGRIEQHARWTAGWARPEKGLAPRLTRLRVEDFEQTVTQHADGALFADCTQAMLHENRCFESQLLKGYGMRVGNMQDVRRYEIFLATPGMAIGDVNGDGLEDIYLCLETGQPNLLLLQQADGTVRNVAHEWGVDWLHNSRSALLVDWDNDGDQDLAVAIVGGVIIASNEGERFKVRSVLPTADDTMSLSAADFDGDGNLDLYVCVYLANYRIGVGKPTVPGAAPGTAVYYDSKGGGPNTLFRNEGNWQFRDVTSDVGLDADNFRQSYAATWEDFDDDGDPDLYVANDFGPGNLFRNDLADTVDGSSKSRVFTDIFASAGNEHRGNGMSAVWGDYNRDGRMDLYVGNMFSAAGNRVTIQPGFKPDAGKDVRAVLQKFARGNSLLKNLGDGLFQETSADARVAMGRWSWGTAFVDLNNDAWEDLVVANGFITGEDARDL